MLIVSVCTDPDNAGLVEGPMVNFVLDKQKGPELLLSLFRLNNHEKMTPSDGESLETLSDWVFKARLSLTEESLTSLDRKSVV